MNKLAIARVKVAFVKMRLLLAQTQFMKGRPVRFIGLLALLLSALFAGCNGKPEKNDLTKAIEEQKLNDREGDTVEHRMEVRQAVVNHMAKYLPEWNIQGIAINSRLGYYSVYVDAASGDKRQSHTFFVALFAKDDGKLYWKTEYIPDDSKQKPLDFTIETYTPTVKAD